MKKAFQVSHSSRDLSELTKLAESLPALYGVSLSDGALHELVEELCLNPASSLYVVSSALGFLPSDCLDRLFTEVADKPVLLASLFLSPHHADPAHSFVKNNDLPFAVLLATVKQMAASFQRVSAAPDRPWSQTSWSWSHMTSSGFWSFLSATVQYPQFIDEVNYALLVSLSAQYPQLASTWAGILADLLSTPSRRELFFGFSPTFEGTFGELKELVLSIEAIE